MVEKIDRFNVAWLALTYKCNNKCIWCYAGSNFYKLMKDKVFNKDKEDDVIKLIKDLGVNKIILIGGEPTLYSNLDNLIRKIIKKNINCSLVTNGRRLSKNDYIKSLRDSGLNSISISIEGSNDNIHDEITKVRGSFNDSVSGLENALNHNVIVSTNTVIATRNINDLINIVERFKDYKLYSNGFNVCGPCVGKEDNNQYMVRLQEAINAFEKVYLHAKKLNIKTKLVTPMPFCNFDINLLKELKTNKAIGGTPCQLSHGKNFIIDYNGDIIPCTHLSGYSYFNIFDNGNILNKADFIEKFNSSNALKFREIASHYASYKCDGCREKHCTGGCPVFYTKFNPNEEIKGQEMSINTINS